MFSRFIDSVVIGLLILLCVALFGIYPVRAEMVNVASYAGCVSGDAYNACGSATIDSSYLSDTALYSACINSVPPDNCSNWQTDNVFKYWSELTANDSIYSGGWVAVSPQYAPTGGSSSSSSSSSSSANPLGVPDLTWLQWGEIITAIAGLFTVIAVIRFVRNNV